MANTFRVPEKVLEAEWERIREECEQRLAVWRKLLDEYEQAPMRIGETIPIRLRSAWKA